VRRQPLIAIGQTRYATAGGTDAMSAQPHWMTLLDGFYANATNGDLPMLAQDIEDLEARGTVMLSGNDGEVILKKILHGAREHDGSLIEGIRVLMQTTPGAYSGCLMTLSELYVYRDPWGFRPLYIGRWRDATVFASETCAFHERDAHIEREVLPGELIKVDIHGGREEHRLVNAGHARQKCIFEPIYFARPDSRVFEDKKDVGLFRDQLGRQLAREHALEDMAVVPIPDSGRFAAMGYASELGLPMRELFIRNPYIPRTFQMAGQSNREDLVRLKFTVMLSLLEEYRRFVIVDDSLVRSTTMRILVEMLRQGAEGVGLKRRDIEVHVRIASPPIVGCCYYGIDTPELDELAASTHSVKEIEGMIDADSLEYLSLPGLDSVAAQFDKPSNFCHACFTGNYPTPYLPRTR
jgi:amidophosphoribosyltransferase